MTDRAPRESLLLPLLIPFGALILIVAALWGFSRILLNTSHAAATVVALAAAAGILAIAAYVAARRNPGNAALFSMVGGAAGLAMLAGGVALVAAPPHGEGEEEGPPIVMIAAPVGAVEDGFASDQVVAPADVPFEIEFDNRDEGQPHNVWISEEEGGATLLETTEIVGPAVTTYPVEDPLAEGEYFFFCSIHPTTMTGTLTAEVGAAGGEGEGGEGEGGEGEGGGGGITVVAQDLAFDPTEVEVPADTPTTITLDNQDDVGTFGPHNLAVYEDDSFASLIGGTDLIDGPGTGTLELPGLAEGSYPFRCDVHTQMIGTVNAVAGGGAPPDEGGEPPPEDGGG